VSVLRPCPEGLGVIEARVPEVKPTACRLLTMLGFLARPVRSLLGETEHEVVDSLHETRDIEANMLSAVQAIENATTSIERHVEVIETLATSVDPLRASVDRLTDTMQELVAILAPMGEAEQEVERIGRFFRRHHRDDKPPPESQAVS
jgi:gamma-glutamyl:cysteine ligase YbdK (ATP-grasp superfamily)